jgi:Flp pilus assembly protein TadB
MPEPLAAAGAIAAGASCAVAVFAIAARREDIDAASWLARRRQKRPAPGTRSLGPWSRALGVAGARDRLMIIIERAGWPESQERLSAFALALAATTTALGVASASVTQVGGAAALGVIGFMSGIGICALAARSAVAARRRRLAAELVPLLELFNLELSGGGSALSALGSVTTKVQGELAADLRRLLIAAQVAGSVPFESRLIQYSEHLDLPALASLATILGASREYGTGVVQGVRALATDLRHAQRRELIAHSRRALNHVLIPAAVGVLLPFLAVVMFPAVTALQQNLH